MWCCLTTNLLDSWIASAQIGIQTSLGCQWTCAKTVLSNHRLSQYNWHNWPRKQLAAHFILEVQAVKVFGASSAENLTSAMPCYVALYKIPKLPQPPSLASMAFQCFDDFSAIAAMYGDSTEFCCVSLEFDRFMGRTDHTLHHSGVCLQTPNVFSSFNCC